MHIAICEDNTTELAAVLQYVIQYQKIHRNVTWEVFHNALDLQLRLQKNAVRVFDVLLLDIFMPVMSGMELAKKIRGSDQHTRIVFLSFSSDFAVESYSVDAYSYLVKPVHRQQLWSLLDRLEQELMREQKDVFVLETKKGLRRFQRSHLLCAEAQNGRLTLGFAGGETVMSTMPLGTLAESLTLHHGFVQPHRSYIVNLNGIEKMNGREIQMVDGRRIPIARGHYGKVRKAYLDFCFGAEDRP